MSNENGTNHGLKSLDTALGVLAFMARQNGPLTLTEIARECDMPPSKVHRYLASFVDAALVRQECRSGRYDLGPGAIQLGLAAIARHDFINFAADGLAKLSRQTGMTILLSVWANEGATVVRWERGATPAVTSIGLGSTLPLLNSATGRAFLTWAPRTALQKSYDSELRRAARNPTIIPDLTPTKAGVCNLVKVTRERGFASVDGKFIPGLVAAAKPVLDWQDEAQAVITMVGVDQKQIHPDSPEIGFLHAFCVKRSVQERAT